MILKFTLWGYPEIAPQVPATLYNLHNISHITTVRICVNVGYRAIQLNGPSGELYTRGELKFENDAHYTEATELSEFLNRFDTSRCQQLGIAYYGFIWEIPTANARCSTYQLLHLMGDLCILTLIELANCPFILALNPDKNPDKIILCPRLEEITLRVYGSFRLYASELLSMAKERASRRAKLSTITIVSGKALAPSTEVFELGKHASRVKCKVNNHGTPHQDPRM